MSLSISESMWVHYAFSPAPNDINYGLACMAAQAVVRNDATVYYDRIINIKSGAFDNTIRAFFDGVILYSGCSLLTAEHMSALGLPFRQEIPAPAQLLSFETHNINTGVEGESKDHISVHELMPCVARKFIAVFNKESMDSYIKALQSHYNKTPFSLVINYMTHAVQIGFDGSKWLSVNQDHAVCGCDAAFDDVLKNILSDASHCDGCWCASVEIVRGKPDVSSAVIVHPIQVNTRKFASLPDAQRQQCIRLALQRGNSEILDAAVKIFDDFQQEGALSNEELIELVTKKNFKGTGLMLALLEGDSEGVKTFMEVLADMLRDGTLSEAELIKLAAAGLKGAPWLYPAMLRGRSEAVKTFMEALADMRKQRILSEKALIELAAAEFKGTPGLFEAILKGHSETVRVFMEVLALMRNQGTLSEEAFSKLAAAEGEGIEKKLPGLLVALKNCDSMMVRAFMEVLALMRKQNVLSEGMFVKLAAAKSFREDPGLLLSLIDGHTEIVKVFMTVLVNMRHEGTLSEKAFVELMAAKTPCGSSGLSLAQENGCDETVQAVIAVLVNMWKGGILSEEALSELAIPQDVLIRVLALQGDNDETVKAFMKVLNDKRKGETLPEAFSQMAV